ncbi:2Fe-2S iron-sulfur cluster binding domain-containing protein [Labilibaculum sp. A4]|uniref:ferredoxin--NADP reductase n=1 Tax=Labilibaculum euxinus TaxID=2686357 RepID=UPI000F625A2F|nr:ferredoxin--NADP reductase [Labilibaculum euxinus]MDQ1769199.1 ferredoxin--NADP reductase [Labilibaculum euxinus]MWN74723.1 2Fe-2S iron-sulfur cluster binding domain-containing protein [Labilibaculum euxinus]
MEQEFYRIPIAAIHKPIKEAVTLSFQIPDELLSVFKFHPGQHLCFRFDVNNKEELRMYSLHNSPYVKGLYQVTVKIQKDGLISNYIADNLKAGDIVEISTPQGDFTVNPDEKAGKSYYLFAAGSGITPIYSMLSSILLAEPNSKVFLLYGNRSIPEILFYNELLEWQAKYPDRLKITQTLSKRFLDFSLTPWDGKRGRINEELVESFLLENAAAPENSEYYICGPDGMNQMVSDTLIDMGVSSKFIHFEYFSTQAIEYEEGLTAVENALVDAAIRNEKFQLHLAQGETILEGLKRIGAPAPYFCQGGICGTCKAHLIEGEVKMKATMALSAEDVKNNVILTCQSLAQTAKVKIEFK